MARKTLHSSDGEGFLRAYWDLIADVEAQYGVVCTLACTRTNRRGVMRFRLVALDAADVPEMRERAVYISDYPTAQVASLEAVLYRCAIKLDHILEMQARYPMGKA